ncbi:hypothetical protein H6504_02855 [Candidatus Woesearchaeota archaeon]|nr:hypothetical protein [Candidatus Woesearchaeota archaeon]
MRLTKKLAKSIIVQIAGQEAERLVDCLYKKENVSEGIITKECEYDINTARSILYQLHEKHIVTFMKKKDRQKGWYIYYWTLDLARVRDISIEFTEQKVDSLKQRLNREQSHLFYTCCQNHCVRFDFDKATDFEFRCPECSSMLIEEDNKQAIILIENEIKKLSKELTA